jgi:hypothetical protein
MLTLYPVERVKLGPWMESVTFVVAVRVSDVPVTVSVVLPGVAVLLTASVSVLVPVVDEGENAAVTPAGRPATERFTVLLKPYSGNTEIVDVPDAP